MLLFLFSISVLYLFPSGASAQEGKEPSLEIGGGTGYSVHHHVAKPRLSDFQSSVRRETGA
jgi:hypothetical protein